MNDAPLLSEDFQRLYCDAAVFEPFSVLHPISFKRVLPFQSTAEVVDDRQLLETEAAHLAGRNDATRRAVVEEYFRCGLLEEMDAANLRSAIDDYDADFFEVMGTAYANAEKFACALRWFREFIRVLESENSLLRSDEAGVYASVGYCLYSLGMFEEAVAWSRSCIGPRQLADTVCQALLNYEAQSAGGGVQSVERLRSRTRYTIRAQATGDVEETVTRLKDAMQAMAPFQEVYIDWVNAESPNPAPCEGYPFGLDADGGNLVRHRMNLLFSLCGQADALVGRGYQREARRLLYEAAMLEPNASFIQDKLQGIEQKT
jgi:tetratricopeptide (TPR) repeat protein